ncbi:hypothetical protein PAXRUDRAFT_771811 [Paxillus rubicundulus Ve08.2h10]|uniref:Uncharacterized protein n=1 Tax=Paxillus rubicundulus Ve08.2h10 TaxID=930991 RepID=A0A0D0C6S7_9AGAM|nr:hypothetical protein PAXRUDRAFT_771811 [Paxillus rubicundulus Ve08.2h10]
MADDAELRLEHRDARDGRGLSPDGQEHSVDEATKFVQIFIGDCHLTAANPRTSCGVHLTDVGREGCSNHLISLTVQQLIRAEAPSRQMQWLKAEGLNCPGYNTFRTAQYWRVTNAEIVASWRFAVDFVSAYDKTSPDKTVCGTVHSITSLFLGLDEISTYGVHGVFTTKKIQEALGVRAP